ncbi:MAG: efflux RND transporter periplasmic adaptor subunit [Spartobacteria bacterium]|nr:efflux RND transporter periplasmic adaptor subunit [Spartobacteria bacterium]
MMRNFLKMPETQRMNEPEKKSKLSHVVLWAVFALILLLVILMGAMKKKEEKKEEIALNPTVVRVTTMAPASIPDVIAIPGRIEPNVEAKLAAEKDGKVTRLTVDKGDQVSKGQLLLEVDKRVWQHMLNKAKLDIREAEKDLERQQGLREAGAISVDEFDDIKTRKEMAEIAVTDAEVNIAQCEIVSPIDGIMDDRRIELGEYARAGDPLFTVVDMDEVKLAINVPERDISKLAVGQEVMFTVAALPGMTFTGQVSFLAVLADRKSNAFDVEVSVANPKHLLKPGMIAESRIVRALRDDAMIIPLASIIPQKGEHVVFLFQEGHAVRRNVQIGALIGSEAVISAGLAPGDEVIVEGHRALVDGAPVVRERAQDATP